LVLFDLLRLIRQERIHLLHVHQYGSSIVGRLAGIISGIPVIMHGHGVDYRYAWYQQVPDWFLAKFTDLTIAVSQEVKELYVNRRKIDERRVVVMPNGISVEDYRPLSEDQRRKLKEKYGLQRDHVVVGTVTRLRREKGNRYFLEAAREVRKRHPQVSFFIAGDGPLLEDLKKLTHRWGLDSAVIFAGYCEDVSQVISIFDIEVIASLTEGSPGALFEAMALGKPIVATNVGGIREVLTDGQNGLLVPPRDAHSLSEKIVYLLRNEPDRRRLGQAARKASQAYSLNAYIRDLERIYEQVSTGRRIDSHEDRGAHRGPTVL
jgi:glycosyltransferase involved in cell wall biosynthesis